MLIRALALDNFRSYPHLVCNFHPGINVLVGGNGQGKTNVLEALNYLATLGSHRVGNDTALIYRPPTQLPDQLPGPGQEISGTDQVGEDIAGPSETENKMPVAAVIRAQVSTGPDETRSSQRLVEIEVVAGRANRARINRNPVRPREVLGSVSAVLFAPEDLALVRDQPGVRRDFLNQLTVQARPALASVMNDADQILRQRAAYLKNVLKGRAAWDEDFLRIWDEQLAPLQAQIMVFRRRLIADLNEFLATDYRLISDSMALARLTYADSLTKSLNLHPQQSEEIYAAAENNDYQPLQEAYLRALLQRRTEERARAVNLVGTHRDEMLCEMGGFPVKGFASHGEMWSFVLALRLASFHYLKNLLDESPLLLLDDVFAELDSARRAALLQVMDQAQQVFITAAVGNELPPDMEAHIFRVTKGQIDAD